MLLAPAVCAAAMEAPAAITLPALKTNALPACNMEAMCWGYWDGTQTQASRAAACSTPHTGQYCYRIRLAGIQGTCTRFHTALVNLAMSLRHQQVAL